MPQPSEVDRFLDEGSGDEIDKFLDGDKADSFLDEPPTPNLTRAASELNPLEVASEQTERQFHVDRKAAIDADIKANPPESVLDRMKRMGGAVADTYAPALAAAEKAPVLGQLVGGIERAGGGAVQALAGARGLVKGAAAYIPEGPGFFGVHPLGAAAKGTAKLAGDMLTPENAALVAGMEVAPGWIRRLAGAGFSVQMFKAAWDESDDFKRAVKAGNIDKAIELGVPLVGNLAMGTGGAIGMFAGATKAPGKFGDAVDWLRKKKPFAEPETAAAPPVAPTAPKLEIPKLDPAELQRRREAAIGHLRASGISEEDLPAAKPPKLNSLLPTEADQQEMARKASYGPLAPDQVPTGIRDRAAAQEALNGLVERLQHGSENPPWKGPKNAFGGTAPLTAFEEQGVPNLGILGNDWAGKKSEIPKELQDKHLSRTGNVAQTNLDIIDMGLSGRESEMTAKEAAHWDKIQNWVWENRGTPTTDAVANYLSSHGYDPTEILRPLKEQVDAEKVAHEEREAISTEPRLSRAKVRAAVMTDEGIAVSGSDHGSAMNRAEDFGYTVSPDRLGQAAGWTVGAPERFIFDKDLLDAEPTEENIRAAADAKYGRHETDPVFDPTELETIPPAGEANVDAFGVDGEPLKPLLPPDKPLRQTVNERFSLMPPQQIAEQVAAVYGIPSQIVVEQGSAHVPAHTELQDGILHVTIPPDYEPYQIVHEVAREGQQFTGKLYDKGAHDDNVIIGKFLQDLRMSGDQGRQANGLPERAFVGSDPNPLAEASGRTYDLDQPFPGSDTLDASVPRLKNIFDPQGIIDPANKGLHGDIEKERAAGVVREANNAGYELVAGAPETFHRALQDWQADFLRSKGFDGAIWKDEMGRHLTEIPRNRPYVEGGPQSAPDGSPLPGAPEETRIASDSEILDTALERHNAESTELHMALDGNLLRPFAKSTLIPMARNLLEALSETSHGLQAALTPYNLLSDDFLTAIMRGIGVKNKQMAAFRLNVGVRQMRKLFDKMGRDEQIGFIDRYKLGETQPTPELTKAAEMIGKIEDTWYDLLDKEMRESGDAGLSYIKNHLALIWEKPRLDMVMKDGELVKDPSPENSPAITDPLKAMEARVFSKRPFEGSKGFTKRMIYESMTEGIKAGLRPVSTNPVVLMELRMADNAKFLSARETLRGLKEKGGSQFVPRAKTQEFLTEHPGWTKLDDRLSDKYFPTEAGMVHAGSYYFEPNVARMLNNYLSYDPIRAMKMGRILMGVKNVTTSFELGLSAFHLSFVNMAASATEFSTGLRALRGGDVTGGLKSLGRSIVPVASGVKYAMDGNKLMRYIADPVEFKQAFGLKGQKFIDAMGGEAKMNKLVDDLFSSGAEVGTNESFRSQTWAAVRDAAHNNDYLGVAMRALPALNTQIMAPLMNGYIPRLKIGAWLQENSRALAENSHALERGDVSPEAVSRLAWRRMEDRFGQVNYDTLGWNPMMKTALQFFFRSVTWKLGNLRTAGRALGAVLNSSEEFNDPLGLAKKITGGRDPNLRPPGSPRMDSDLAFILGTAISTTMIGNIAQKTMTGKWSWETDTPLVDSFFPRNGELDAMGHPSRMNIPTYIRDYVGLARSAKAAAGLHFGDASSYVTHSLALPVGRFAEIVQNKDFYGNWIYDPEAEPLKRAAAMIWHQLKPPLPISVQSMMQTKTAGAQAAGFFGFTKASPTYFYTDGEEYVANVIRRQSSAFPGRNPEFQNTRDAMDRVRQAIAKGMPPDEADVKIVPKSTLTKAYTDKAVDGFGRRLEGASMGPLEIMNGWQYFNDEEKAIAWPILSAKMARLRDTNTEKYAHTHAKFDALKASMGDTGTSVPGI